MSHIPFREDVIELTNDTVGPAVVAELRGLHKRYGKRQALRGVDLQVHPGELVALLGPNGAGKTTAVSVLLGQRRPDAGSARLFGQDPTRPAARRSVGATPQQTGLPDNLTVAEVVDLVRVFVAEGGTMLLTTHYLVEAQAWPPGWW